MKNNSLAMLATISLVISVGLLISYSDPAVCAGSGIASLESCTSSANQNLWGFVGFAAFGVSTLVAGTVRNRVQVKRRRYEDAKAE